MRTVLAFLHLEFFPRFSQCWKNSTKMLLLHMACLSHFLFCMYDKSVVIFVQSIAPYVLVLCLALSVKGKEMIEMYFDFRLYRLWKTRQHSKLLDYEDLLWPRVPENVGPSSQNSPCPLWNTTSHQLSWRRTGTGHHATGIWESVIMYFNTSLETLSHECGRWAQSWRQRWEGTCAKDSISCQSKQSEIFPWWQCRRMEADYPVFSMSHIYFTKALSLEEYCA